jgi:hypothetical protein
MSGYTLAKIIVKLTVIKFCVRICRPAKAILFQNIFNNYVASGRFCVKSLVYMECTL